MTLSGNIIKLNEGTFNWSRSKYCRSKMVKLIGYSFNFLFFCIFISNLFICFFGAFFRQSGMLTNYFIWHFSQVIQRNEMSSDWKATEYFKLDLSDESDETLVTLKLVQTTTKTILFNTYFPGEAFHGEPFSNPRVSIFHYLSQSTYCGQMTSYW